MRRLLAIAALVCITAVFNTAAAAVHRASLRLDDASTPPTLLGSRFQPRERVRVVVIAGSTRTLRRIVAGARGRFLLRLQGEEVSACAGFSASAVGSLGSRASLKRAPGQCPLP
ncbi:MAG: hypothetical protein C5B48_15905 [Candidatus Rokuibacteriota bacterium]|nr:MAG: hypothetical protein C5B48_15905 [Candidatus Rokubacteria bacterium]